ncbi:hypothetical protein OAH18_00130 [bacterium]|nr:hypothetical protein [bacterium]
MKPTRTIVGVFAILLAGATFSIIQAQDQNPFLQTGLNPIVRTYQGQPKVTGLARTPFASTHQSEDRKLQATTESIVNKLRKANAATTDEEKQAAEEVLETAETELRVTVGKRFDLLIKKREKQIEDLQKQINALETEINKRRDAKQEIVDLRVKTLMYEASGLGFPNSIGRSVFTGNTNRLNSYFNQTRELTNSRNVAPRTSSFRSATPKPARVESN